jgi:hypothetical protein
MPFPVDRPVRALHARKKLRIASIPPATPRIPDRDATYKKPFLSQRLDIYRL